MQNKGIGIQLVDIVSHKPVVTKTIVHYIGNRFKTAISFPIRFNLNDIPKRFLNMATYIYITSYHRHSHPCTHLSLIHISEPTRLGMISYAVFCLKKKKIK